MNTLTDTLELCAQFSNKYSRNICKIQIKLQNTFHFLTAFLVLSLQLIILNII